MAKDSKGKRLLEQSLHAQSHALAERVKELEAIHTVSDLFEAKNLELSEIFQKIVNILPAA